MSFYSLAQVYSANMFGSLISVSMDPETVKKCYAGCEATFSTVIQLFPVYLDHTIKSLWSWKFCQNGKKKSIKSKMKNHRHLACYLYLSIVLPSHYIVPWFQKKYSIWEMERRGTEPPENSGAPDGSSFQFLPMEFGKIPKAYVLLWVFLIFKNTLKSFGIWISKASHFNVLQSSKE